MEDLLLTRERLRYNGKVVGSYGPVATLDEKLFIWRQVPFRAYGGGYCMSEGLAKKLDDEGVGYVYISDADYMALLGEIRNSMYIDPWDKVFDGADPRPREPSTS